jgi:competence protein ComEC
MTEPILDKSSLNLSSIVIRLTFGNNSFLFMGDAETKNEGTRDWPKTDVLKVGHHGSNTSTSESFLKQVSPQYAVIMAGEGNSYGLPKANIMERLNNINATLYRTDRDGTIEMISDGNQITVNVSNN